MSSGTPVEVGKARRILGWSAVAISAFIGAFLGLFASGEGVTEGWGPFLAHLAQATVVVLLAVCAVRWPRLGGSLFFLAALGVAWQFGLGLSALPLFAPLALLGLLYFFGRPAPRRLAYILVAGVPATVIMLAALVGTVVTRFR